jgi:hypothetical protein
VGDCHTLTEILGNVANRIEVGIGCLRAALEVRGLGNLARSQYADAETSFLFCWHRKALRVGY